MWYRSSTRPFAARRRRQLSASIRQVVERLEVRQHLDASYLNDGGTTTAFSSSAVTIQQGDALFVTAVTPQSGVTTGISNAMTAKFSWNFGDTANEGKIAHANGMVYDDNLADGYNASHVYDTPGTYTVTQSIQSSPTAQPTVLTQTVTVTASARAKVYIATDGETAAVGNGSASTPYNLRGLEAYLGTLTAATKTNLEFLFQAGQTFSLGASGKPFANALDFSGYTHLKLGRYGTSATDPTIYWAGGSLNSMITFTGSRDVSVEHLQIATRFDTKSDGTTHWEKSEVVNNQRIEVPVAIRTGVGTRELSVRNVRFRDVNYGVNNEVDFNGGQVAPSGLLVQDSGAYADSGAPKNEIRSYFVWLLGKYITVQGNKVDNSTIEHVVRGGGFNGKDVLAGDPGWFGVNIAYNQFDNVTDTSTPDKIEKSTINLQSGAYAYVTNNRFDAVASVGPLGSGNSGTDDQYNRTKYVVVENNQINAALQVQNGTSDVDVRQNTFHIDGTQVDGSLGVIVAAYQKTYRYVDANDVPQIRNYNRGTSRVRVLYNTFEVQAGRYYITAVDIEGGADVGGHADHEVAGNVLHYVGTSNTKDDRSIIVGTNSDREVTVGGTTKPWNTTGADLADVGSDFGAYLARTFKAGGVGQNYWYDNNGATDDAAVPLAGFRYTSTTSLYERPDYATPAVWNAELVNSAVALKNGSNVVQPDGWQQWTFGSDGAPATTAADIGLGFLGALADGSAPPRGRPPVGSGTLGSGWTLGAIQHVGSIAGTVYNDLDGDGTLDTGEPGLSGRTVYLDSDNDGVFDSGETSAVTNSSGAYTLTGVPVGTRTVRQAPFTGWASTNAGSTVVVASGGTVTATALGSYQAPGSIAGTVFNDLDHDGTFDANEPGLSGRTVYLDADLDGVFDSGETSTTTATNGTYTFTNVPVGSRVVRQVLPTGWVATTSANGSLVTVASNNTAPADPLGSYLPPTQTPAGTGPTVTTTATQDAYVQDGTSETSNFGTAPDLAVKNNGTGTTAGNRITYLQFDLSTLNSSLNASKLRIYGNLTAAETNGVTVEAHNVPTAWSEPSITFNTKPAFDTASAGTVSVTSTTNEWYEIDLTALVKSALLANQTTLNLALLSPASTPYYALVRLNSKEQANGPQLVSTLTRTTNAAAQDAYVQDGTANSGMNYGSAPDLVVKNTGTANSGGNRVSFVKFDLSNVTTAFTSSVLRLVGNLTATEANGVLIEVRNVTGAWAGSGVTWDTQPAYDAAAKATFNVTATTNQTYDVDVTSMVRAALAAGQTTLSLALFSPAATPNYAAVRFNASEQSGGPQLLTSYIRVATDKIEAESADATSGTVQQAIPGGGQALGSFDNGDSIKFAKVDFGTAGVTGFTMRVAQNQTASRFFKLYVDGMPGAGGMLVGTYQLSSTGGWNAYVDQTRALGTTLYGVHDLYVIGDGTSTGIGNIDWTRFNA